MSVKLLTELHLEFLSLKVGCTGSSESTLVKMPHYLKSHVKAYIVCTWHSHLNSSDVNECEETPGVCDQICVNRYGSHRCRCRPGYRRLSRGRCVGKLAQCCLLFYHHHFLFFQISFKPF